MRHHGVCISNNMAADRTFDDLDLTNDEIKRLGEALKDETFRKLLVEYAEEISNPENRRKAEEEIAIIENERGMSCTFIHPVPGYVMKTTVDGTRKCFINICQNQNIEKPKAKKQFGPDNKTGFLWQIPHSFAPPRDDYDKVQNKCTVFDVVFHPDTYRMAMSNARFKKLVEDTAVEGIERQFGVTLDKKNIKYPKMKFKGVPQATVIREKLANVSREKADANSILDQMPYPYDNTSSSEKAKENEMKHVKKNYNKIVNGNLKSSDQFTEPKYTVTHRSELDMSEYRDAPDARTSTRPKELVIKIELPLLTSAAQASLDIFESRLVLKSVSPAAYRLDLPLPFPVNEEEGSAKFDKCKRTLTVTVPVLPSKLPPLPFSSIDHSESQNIVNDFEVPLVEVISNGKSNDNVLKTDSNEELTNGFHSANIDTNDNEEHVTSLMGKADINDSKEHDTSFMEKDEIAKKMKFPQNVKWILPDYQFSQDNETVSFVIKVQSVQEKSVQMLFLQTTVTIIQFMSIGAGCFPVYYSLYVEFANGCNISAQHCSIDVSDDNLVFVILKDKSCRGLWDSFNIGVDCNQLEKKQFLTESNLQRELSDLDQEAVDEINMPVIEETTAILSVVEMNEKRLTIDIKPSKGKKKKMMTESKEGLEDENDEYDMPSTAEIEVVHKHPPPELHSILKQRTVSESSEDVTSNVDPESPRSESEELSSSFTKKRSVSFSSHVDHTSFKSSASVSSMTQALKSKRRRQRKREAKIKGRVRHHSEGTSSSEESLLSVSDAYSYSEGEESSEKLNEGKRNVLHRCMSDPGPERKGLFTIKDVEEEKERGAGEPGKKVKAKKSKASADPGLIPYTKDVLDFRTKNPEATSASLVNSSEKSDASILSEENKIEIPQDENEEVMKNDGVDEKNGDEIVDKKKGESECVKINSIEAPNAVDDNNKTITEIKIKFAGRDSADDKCEKEEEDSDDLDGTVSSMMEEFSLKADEGGKLCGSESEVPSEPEEKLVEVIEDESSYVGVGDKKPEPKGQLGSEWGDESKVPEKCVGETMLNWEDGQVNGEHVTQCAFQFSNSLIFDLDLD